MKILLATGLFPPDSGGPATYAKLLADELPKKGIEVDVLSFGTVRHLPKLIRHLVLAGKIIWHARESDVVFAQDTVSVGLPAMVAALILGKPFLVRVPGDHAWEQSVQRFGVKDTIDDFQNKRYGFKTETIRRVQRLVVGQADAVMAPSRYFADLVRGWVKDPAKVTAVYNGIDLKIAEQASKGVVYKPKTIISVGRLVPWKGFDMLIRIMDKLPEWELDIVGDGPEMERLQGLVAEGHSTDRIFMRGRMDNKDLLRRIASSEAFILNTSFESFSYLVAEAMAVGTPVVTTRIGNLAEIVDDGVNGILLQPNDEVGLITAIKKISDPAIRKKFSEAGRKKAAQFSIENTLNNVKGIIGSLTSAEHASRRTKKVFAAKIFRYLFSGGSAAFTDLFLLYVLTDFIGLWYLLSSILAFLVAFVVSFVLQKFFTFQDHGMDGVKGQAAVYFVVTGTNLLINTGLIYLFVQYAGLHYLPAQIVTSIIIAIESFLIYQRFIFRARPSK